MRGELEAPVDLGGRYARACPEHNRILEGLDCPMGHHVEKWATYDRQKGVFLAEEIDADSHEIHEVAPRPIRGPCNLPRHERMEAMSEASPEKKTKTVASTRFVDQSRKEILFVQMVHKISTRGTTPPWRVGWRRLLGDKTETAWIVVTKEEAEAKQKYADTVRSVTKDGWREEASRRSVVIRAAPKPGAAPAFNAPIGGKGAKARAGKRG
jgi:hypothetical protein